MDVISQRKALGKASHVAVAEDVAHENFRSDRSLNKALIFKPNSDLTRN